MTLGKESAGGREGGKGGGRGGKEGGRMGGRERGTQASRKAGRRQGRKVSGTQWSSSTHWLCSTHTKVLGLVVSTRLASQLVTYGSTRCDSSSALSSSSGLNIPCWKHPLSLVLATRLSSSSGLNIPPSPPSLPAILPNPKKSVPCNIYCIKVLIKPSYSMLFRKWDLGTNHTAPCRLPIGIPFSKVSALVYSLYKVTIQFT